MPDGNGGTSRRQHLEQVEKTLGEKPPELAEQPDKPEAMMYLWQWFCELGDFSYTELHHWSQLKMVSLRPWEVEILRELDAIRSEVWRERNSSSNNSS